jgi:hypothetical protein
MLKTDILPLLPENSILKDWMALHSHTEPPRSFILGACLFAFAALIGKRVWINLGDRNTYLNLNVIFAGLSGLGKSTVIEEARNLIRAVNKDKPLSPYINGLGTKEKLLMDLQLCPHTCIIASELSAQLSKAKYLETLIPALTDLMDWPSEYRAMGSKKDGPIRIENPRLTLLGGTTPEWLETQMPEAAIAGGWLPRHLIFNENSKHQSVPIPRRLLGDGGLQRLEQDKERFTAKMIECLDFSGEIDFKDSETEDILVHWVNTFQIPNSALAPFQERGKEQVLKLAIIVALSCRDKAISSEHLQCAIKIFEYCASRLVTIAIPFTLGGKLHNQVLKNITRSGDKGLTRVEIRRSMLHSLGARETDKVIESLLECEKIQENDGRFVVAEENPAEGSS